MIVIVYLFDYSTMIINKASKRLCDILATSGLQENLVLHTNLDPIFTQYRGSDYLSVVFSTALLWSQYAHNNNGFLDYAVPFFGSTDHVDQNEIVRHSTHRGHDNLAVALTNLRNFRNKLTVIPDFSSCSTKDIIKFQQRSYSTLVFNVTRGQITSIGPWLFLGPVKIILGHENRLWQDPDTDALIMPSGIEVIRGIRYLIRNTDIIQSLTPSDLYEDEGDIFSGHARDCMIHNEAKNIAIETNSRVFHINTALYQLGAGNIAV